MTYDDTPRLHVRGDDILNARTAGGVTRSLDTLDSGLEDILGAYNNVREALYALVERLSPVLHPDGPELVGREDSTRAIPAPSCALHGAIDARSERTFALAGSLREVEQILRTTIERLEV